MIDGKGKVILIAALVVVSIVIAIPAFAGWDMYIACYGDASTSYPFYPNGFVARLDETGANKPGVWHIGQPEEQIKPLALFAESDCNRAFDVDVKSDGTVLVTCFAQGGVVTYDQNGDPIIQNASNNPPHVLYQNVDSAGSPLYGGAAQLILTDQYAFAAARYLQDTSPNGGVCQFDLNPATKPGVPINLWFCEAPFGVQGLRPYTFTILPDGRFFVIGHNYGFFWFDADGIYLDSIQLNPNFPNYVGDYATMNGVDVKDGYVYVSLATANQVRRWAIEPDTTWTMDATLALSGTLPSGPQGIKWGPDGNLYVACTGNDSILKYSFSGAYIGVVTNNAASGIHSPRNINFFETAGGAVTGTITLGDWAGVVAGTAATIDIRNGVGTTVETQNITLAADGGFSFTTALADGSYTAVAKAGHWLAKAMPLTISGGSGTVSFTLANGDCNGDNGVDEIDYALLSNAWYQALGDPAYNADADLNGDGGVDEIDYAILSNAWYTAGD